MRLPGYKRRDPDPVSVGVMTATPRQWFQPLPRPRWHPACWLRGHRPEWTSIRATGEQWTMHIPVCRRCNRLLDEGHAARSHDPVIDA